MKLAFRSVPALLFAALLALPGIGSDGGEGAGGTGVWILPIPKVVGPCPLAAAPSVPSQTMVVSATASFTLKTATSLGACTAVLIDELSGVPMQLPVAERNVTLEKETLQGLLGSGVDSAHIVITDANQLGYVFKISVNAAESSLEITLR